MSVKKGYIKNKSTKKIQKFMYNPSDFSDDVSTSFGEISPPGSSYPKFQYISGDSKVLSVDLYITGKASEVKSQLNFIEAFRPKRGTKFSKPPVLIFAMGDYVLEGIVASISRKFTKFDKNLKATEVTVTLKIKEI